MKVRDFRDDDVGGCLAVFDSNVPRFFTPPERPGFLAFLAELPGPYLVVEDDAARIVACGGHALVPESGRADLCWGMVRGELHGTGLGRLLMEARLARALADSRVRVVALNTSQLTTGFYERFGFVTTEVIENGYAPGLHRCEMRLQIDGPG